MKITLKTWLGLIAALALFLNTRDMVMGVSQMPLSVYWFSTVCALFLIFLGIFSMSPKWIAILYFVVQVLFITIGIAEYRSNVYESMFLGALISMMFCLMPLVIWFDVNIFTPTLRQIFK